MNKINDIQKEMEEIKYPDNYYYDIESITPKGLLSERIEKLKIGAPELFEKTDSYLDIGCSLGYFLFHHKKIGTKHVCGTDMDANQLTVTRKVKEIKGYDDVKIVENKFGEFSDERQYDLIYMGNIFHYLYREYTWDIVYKITALAKKYVVLELPLTFEYLLFFGWGDNEMTRGFNKETFFSKFGEFFDVVRISDSKCYDRKIVVLKKKRNTYENEIDVEDIEMDGLFVTANNSNARFDILIDHEKKIKYKILRSENTFKLHLPSYIMTLTNSTPNFISHIKRGDNFIGYAMEYVDGTNHPEKDKIFEKLVEIAKITASCGIVFWDLGRKNFLISDSGEVKHFDIDEYSWKADLYNIPKTKKPFDWLEHQYNWADDRYEWSKEHYEWFIKSTINEEVQNSIPSVLFYDKLADDFIENIGNRNWFISLLEKYEKIIKDKKDE